MTNHVIIHTKRHFLTCERLFRLAGYIVDTSCSHEPLRACAAGWDDE